MRQSKSILSVPSQTKLRSLVTGFAVAVSCTVAFEGVALSCDDAWQNRKKIISIGFEWGNAQADDLLRFQPQIAASGIDGAVVYLYGEADGKKANSTKIVDDNVRWTRAMFEPQLSAYRKAFALPGLRHSFFDSFRPPHKKHIAWRDDATWERIANNVRLSAWVAKEAGAKGLFCDVEEYIHDFPQFRRHADDPEWAELAEIVRRRGREVFRGVFEEFPDVRIFFTWLLGSHGHEILTSTDPLTTLENKGDLWPLFVNGIVDVATDRCRLIDGNETSYEYLAQREDYIRGCQRLRTNSIALIDPKNRAKFRAIGQVAPALYLDMYVSSNRKSMWYKAPHLGSRLGQFQFDLAQALEATDEYVWYWGERYRVIPWAKDYKKNAWVKPDTWEEHLPGMTDVVRALTDPKAYLAHFEPAKHVNLAADPSKFGFWQDSNTWMPQGEFAKPRQGEARVSEVTTISGSGEGTLLVSVPARSGEIYVVRVKSRRRGGYAHAVVRFQDENGWCFCRPAVAVPFGADDEGGWRLGQAVVPVPNGVTKLVLLPSVRQTKDDSCEFRDVGVYRIR